MPKRRLRRGKKGPRAYKKDPRGAEDAPKKAREPSKSDQEPHKRHSGGAETAPKSCVERARIGIADALGRIACLRSCRADSCSFSASCAGWPACSDVRFVPPLPMFCKARSIHATPAPKHAKAHKTGGERSESAQNGGESPGTRPRDAGRRHVSLGSIL